MVFPTAGKASAEPVTTGGGSCLAAQDASDAARSIGRTVRIRRALERSIREISFASNSPSGAQPRQPPKRSRIRRGSPCQKLKFEGVRLNVETKQCKQYYDCADACDDPPGFHAWVNIASNGHLPQHSTSASEMLNTIETSRPSDFVILT